MFSDEKKGLFIKAKDGIIKVLEIQGENAKKMNVGDFLRGNRINAGNIFEEILNWGQAYFSTFF